MVELIIRINQISGMVTEVNTRRKEKSATFAEQIIASKFEDDITENISQLKYDIVKLLEDKLLEEAQK